ncbi:MULTISPECIES: acyl-CoA/acyl-ACP dehydrogenase [Pseudomonadota]|jgi:alkylation response protein AidB-like acyl-CoA dehydrogenase|uniref:Acyl-CoA/acyl-ACP dehydrogenase n=1 Tax=Yanghanlia caeni TaxID=3064283 RepID=A0ABU1D887_9BURK|nr:MULTISPECIES: acyl-CoA/acyl-ACP dehydrogenase [Gammaproteobacteria]MBE7423739.1 acyl-CoA/acyl-ACP dehydrogenase [Zoogloeaceae bacterium]MBJ5599258.1 acyl-CoA/acyl-ACP dehydrogenase [Salmonella enterica subsp. enterica serovar Thompson]MDR4126671.1 acyl-CoA/acyl-ACP dehydrogenase [Alcaligenaceae bacterium LG-2]NLI41757.1 acyl-CoA/acyl-ACP dehydrogenase [Caldisericales bacterium]MBJ5650953.1 acyl-CoA/acyl-ACP dehydrogenase [Salmonella enterica subsp. enterica serovar Thompson]
MIDFELDQEQKMLTDAIRRLAEERIRKVFRDADEETDRNCHFGFFAVSGQNSVFPPNYDCFRTPNN